MSNCPDLLAALKLRQRDLELDAVAIRSRIEEVAEMIAMLEQPQRAKRGRPPGPRAVFTARRPQPNVEVVNDATAPELFTHNDDDNEGDAA